MATVEQVGKSNRIYSDVLDDSEVNAGIKEQIDSAEEVISDAITKATLSSMPFFGVLITSTKRFPSSSCDGVFGTNGDVFIYNYEKVLNYSVEEVEFAVVHASMHIALEHFIRGEHLDDVDDDTWHYACDLAINSMLKERDDLAFPDFALFDRDYSEMSAEEIYQELGESDIEFYKDSNLETDEHYPGPNEGSTDHEKVKDRLQNTHSVSKGQGRVFNEVSKRIEGFSENQVDWREVLRNFVGQKINREEHSLMPPNKRYLDMFNACLPTLRGKEIGKVIISIDTSGSIAQNQLEQFVSEIEKLDNKVSEVTILLSNTMVYETIEPNNVKEFLSNAKTGDRTFMGGGTSHVDVFEKIRDKFHNTELFIGLTDGHTELPEYKPNFPSLWVLTNDGSDENLNFGRVVQMLEE